MNKKEALEQLREHLSTAPIPLKEYVIKSWEKQTKDLECTNEEFEWFNAEFIVESSSKESEFFWRAIYDKEWWRVLLYIPNYQSAYDYINPSHYKQSGKEVIDMMVDIWGKDAVSIHCEITAFKYRMRLGLKPDQPIERDLEKAKWYEAKAKELKGNAENL